MSYATERDAAARTAQAILTLGVPVCENFYATQVKQLLQRTEEFDHATWTKSGITVLADNPIFYAPDGYTTTSDRIIGAASGDYLEQVATGYPAASATFVFSVFLCDAAGDIQLQIRDSTGSEIGSQTFAVTSSWTRVSLAFQFSGAATGDVRVRIVKLAGFATGHQVWGANLTKNPVNNGLLALFPYVKRVAEADTVLATMASRCQAADAGDGSRCAYTLTAKGCQDPANYNPGNRWSFPLLQLFPLGSNGDPRNGIREYKFCLNDAPLPFTGGTLIRPMLESWEQAPQEIDGVKGVMNKDGDGGFLTKSETVEYRLEDDALPGLWDIDKYSLGALVNTSPGSGTFFRRWKAIHPNFDNPRGYAKLSTGYVFAGSTEGDYQLRLSGPIKRVRVSHDDVAMIEAIDGLGLTKRKIPSSIGSSNVLSVGVDASATSISVTDPTQISDPAPNADQAEVFDSAGARTSGPDWTVVLQWGTEKMTLTAKTNGGNPLTVRRGRWGTAAIAHAAGEGFTEIREFGTEAADPSSAVLGVNPIDAKLMLFREAGLPWDQIDWSFHRDQRNTWVISSVDRVLHLQSGVLFRNTVTEPTDIEALLREIDRDLVSFQYVNDARQVVTRVFAPPTPSDMLVELTDVSFADEPGVDVEDDLEPRLSRVAIGWDLIAGRSGDVLGDYAKQALAVEPSAEAGGAHGSIADIVLLSRWIRAADTSQGPATAARVLARFIDGARLVTGSLEAKDDDNVKLGTFVYVTTDQIQTASGATDSKRIMLTTWKGRSADGDRMALRFLDCASLRRVLFVAPIGHPDYDASTPDQQRYGYVGDLQNRVGAAKVDGYYVR